MSNQFKEIENGALTERLTFVRSCTYQHPGYAEIMLNYDVDQCQRGVEACYLLFATDGLQHNLSAVFSENAHDSENNIREPASEDFERETNLTGKPYKLSDAWTENTGGGCMVDFLVFQNGVLATISDDVAIIQRIPDYVKTDSDSITEYWYETNTSEHTLNGGTVIAIPLFRDAPPALPARFFCVWGRGYHTGPNAVGIVKTEEHGSDFFHEGNGYSAHNIDRVLALDIGDCHGISEFGAYHSIVRIA